MGNRTGSSKRIARKKLARKAGVTATKDGTGKKAKGRKQFAVGVRVAPRPGSGRHSRVRNDGEWEDCEDAGPETPEQALERERARQRSDVLRTHARERMVLKEHLRKLNMAKARLTKGENVKTERRQMAKYIRTLTEQQQQKHAKELAEVTTQHVCARQQALMRSLEGEGDFQPVDTNVSDDQLRQMFANLVDS